LAHDFLQGEFDELPFLFRTGRYHGFLEQFLIELNCGPY
jgi:hypothetical protein